MDLSHLNDKQREAVMHTEGPLLILAGAGSGKTSTMTHRMAYLVEQGVDPYNILAVTFTNKAAGEMRERVEVLIGDTGGMWIMTFHAMCVRILRRDADLLGYDKNFVIYDAADQKTVIKNIIKEQNIDPKAYKIPYLLSVISDKKEKGISAAEFERREGNDFRNKVPVLVYKEYEKKLLENDAMDFDDLLVNAVRLFRADEATLLKYRNRFRYIMVDEYQDTNHVQYELVKMLAEKHKNICVVGDDDQCIYEWRGADIRNILDFEKDFPQAKVIKLEQNYRSKGNILAAAHSVIENNRGRKAKRLWTEKEDGEKITYHRADTEKDEASFVAGEIALLHGRNDDLKYSDFAILYRTNAQSRQFEEAFTRRGIPYRVLSGLRYYDRKEIKDMMAYMRLIVNPKDELSLQRIINEPKRGVGEKTMDKLAAFASVRGESILESLKDEEVLGTLPGRAYDNVKQLVETLTLLRDERDNLRVSDVYDQLLVKTGYLKALEDENTVEAESRIENLMEFKSVIYDYESEAQAQAMRYQAAEGKSEDDPFRIGLDDDEAPKPPTVEGFMERIALMAEVDNHDAGTDAVVMMTLHSAKGLEFPVVFMPGMEDGLFPGSRSFDSTEGMEEERRLCYVGMTRAKERLFLTGAAVRTLYGRTDYTRESQFLREVDKRLLTGDSVFDRGARRRFAEGYPGPGVSTGSTDGYSDPKLAGYKPYDALKYSRMETRRAAASGSADFAEGDRVSHAKFGNGTVAAIKGNVITVSFDDGSVKKLAMGIAPIKKI